MTTTSLIRPEPQDIRDTRIAERRRALLRIAEIHVQEAGYCTEDFAPSVLALIVPQLAAAAVTFPLVEFEVLCDAVRAFQDFCNDERGWLEAAGMRADGPTSEAQHQVLAGAIESALDRLQGRRS